MVADWKTESGGFIAFFEGSVIPLRESFKYLNRGFNWDFRVDAKSVFCNVWSVIKKL